MNRRNWLKISALLGVSTYLGTSYAAQTGCWSPAFSDLPQEWLRLGSNENPYGCSPKVMQAMQAALKECNRYPNFDLLLQKLSDYHQIAKEQICITAGSSEALALAAIAFARNKRENIITAKPTFNVFPDIAERLGTKRIDVPLTAEKVIDLHAMAAAVNKRTAAVYVCNPNNPTGSKLETETLHNFVRTISQKTTVVVDEVYHDFIEAPSLIAQTANNPRLVVIRSFSKVYGLAGMRIGYAVAHPDTIKKMTALIARPGICISQAGVAGAIAALEDRDFVRMSVEKNRESQEILYAYLRQAGIRYIPSYANLVYFSLEGFPKTYLEDMKARKVIVREIDDYGQRWCRVSMGSPEEMKRFVEILKSMRS
ncbi:MAG: histidinol-phosphate transaminase [Cytophagales bacterium]|nr:histidinol-phosphate aminotransferase family protein [Bernardetiaceae bacterium]MDW8209687.1 histidinol-phosphate transaminase [Cytophagales bacterium]